MSYRKTRVREGQLYVGNRLSLVVIRKMLTRSDHWLCAVTYQRIGQTELEVRSEYYLENKVKRAR